MPGWQKAALRQAYDRPATSPRPTHPSLDDQWHVRGRATEDAPLVNAGPPPTALVAIERHEGHLNAGRILSRACVCVIWRRRQGRVRYDPARRRAFQRVILARAA